MLNTIVCYRALDENNKALKIINQIIDNIIINPSEAKYQTLKLETLLSKLNNDDTWIGLLLNAGFVISTDGQHLIFDNKNLETLKGVKSVISNISDQSMTNKQQHSTAIIERYNNFKAVQSSFLHLLSNERGTEEMLNDVNPNGKDDINIMCTCCRPLTKSDDALSVCGTGISCDVCGGDGQRGQTVYHCDKGKVEPNPDGFDICAFVQDSQISNNITQQLITNECCCNNIQICPHFNQLSTALDSNYNEDAVDITELLNNHKHLIEHHDNDKDFNFIVQSLTKCVLSKCDRFSRNYRERKLVTNKAELEIDDDDEEEFESKMDVKDLATRQIKDKLHCYYCHSIDIGNRFSLDELKSIECVSNSHQRENLLNQKLLKMNKIISKKIEKLKKHTQPHFTRTNMQNSPITMLQNFISRDLHLFTMKKWMRRYTSIRMTILWMNQKI